MTRIFYLLLAILGLSACGAGESPTGSTPPPSQSVVSQPESSQPQDNSSSQEEPMLKIAVGDQELLATCSVYREIAHSQLGHQAEPGLNSRTGAEEGNDLAARAVAQAEDNSRQAEPAPSSRTGASEGTDSAARAAAQAEAGDSAGPAPSSAGEAAREFAPPAGETGRQEGCQREGPEGAFQGKEGV